MNYKERHFRATEIQIFYVIVPLFVLQSLSIPFLPIAKRATSQNDSLILKSQRGEISNKGILCLDAYSSADRAATCRLKAR